MKSNNLTARGFELDHFRTAGDFERLADIVASGIALTQVVCLLSCRVR
jgi:hypothetical protein